MVISQCSRSPFNQKGLTICDSVAHIHDSRYEQWFLFNDETVAQEDIVTPGPVPKAATSNKSTRSPLATRSNTQEIGGSNFYSASKRDEGRRRGTSTPIVIDDSDDGFATQPKVTRTYESKRTSRSGSSDSHRGHPFIPRCARSIVSRKLDLTSLHSEVKSKEAYMLVYTRREESGRPRSVSQGVRGRSTSAVPPHAATVQIPLAVQQALDANTASRAADLEEHATREAICRADFEALRERKRAVWNSWQAQPDEEAYLFDTRELEKWMLAEIDPPKKGAKKKSKSKQVQTAPISPDSDSDCVTVQASLTVTKHKQPKSSSGSDSGKQPSSRRSDDSGFNELAVASFQQTAAQQNGHTPMVADKPTPSILGNGSITNGAHRSVSPGRAQVVVEVPQHGRSDSPARSFTTGQGAGVQQPEPLLSQRSYAKASIFPTGRSPARATFVQGSGSPANPPSSLSTHDAPPDSGVRLGEANGVNSIEVDDSAKLSPAGGACAADHAPETVASINGQEPSEEVETVGATNKQAATANKLKPLTEIDNCYLLCQHNKVDFRRFDSMKAINRVGKDAIESLGVSIKPVFIASLDLCRMCCFEPFAKSRYSYLHKSDLAKFKEGCKGHGDPRYISKAWLKSWQKDMPDFHQAGALMDPDPHSGSFKADVFCPHGFIQPDDTIRTIITGKVRPVCTDQSKLNFVLNSKQCCSSGLFRTIVRQARKKRNARSALRSTQNSRQLTRSP